MFSNINYTLSATRR